MTDTYDFIVTGAGSAGCAVAGRLSEDGKYRVLLLEAGPRDCYPWIHIPLGYHKTFNNPKVNWMFDSEPEPELNGRVMYQPRGKVLGGTSSINGMVYMRGNAADYDEWRQRGCEGWDYDFVLPYFKKAEDNQRGGDEFHGTGGPLKVQDHRWQPTLARALHDAAIEAGIPANADFNGAQQEGVGYYQTTINNARRWSSARAYLRKRPNLTIATGAHATRVLIENGRAVGVEYRTPDGLLTARAGREVIVSGGVYGSPQLLMLSGLGPAAHLQQHGIKVIKDMPGVGSHLHDHFNTYVAYKCSPAGHHERPGQQPAAPRHGGGAICAGPHRAARQHGPVRRRPGQERQAAGAAGPADQHVRLGGQGAEPPRRGGRSPSRRLASAPCTCGPTAAARCGCKSADPMAAPEIRFNFLKSANDWNAMLQGMRICREIGRQPALRPFVVEEIEPGPAVTEEKALRDYIRATGVSNLHPVGTCRMGRARRRRRRPAAQGPWHRGAARRRRLDHAVDRGRQHQRALDHDRREVRRHGAGAARTGRV